MLSRYPFNQPTGPPPQFLDDSLAKESRNFQQPRLKGWPWNLGAPVTMATLPNGWYLPGKWGLFMAIFMSMLVYRCTSPGTHHKCPDSYTIISDGTVCQVGWLKWRMTFLILCSTNGWWRLVVEDTILRNHPLKGSSREICAFLVTHQHSPPQKHWLVCMCKKWIVYYPSFLSIDRGPKFWAT